MIMRGYKPPDSHNNVKTVSIGAHVGSPHTISLASNIKPIKNTISM